MKNLTVPEVAEALRESKLTTRRRLAAGELRGIKVGRQWLVREDDLEAFLNRKVHVAGDGRRRRR